MSEYYTFDCEYLAESSTGAIKVEYQGEVLWFPLSTVKSITKRLNGTCTLSVQSWIAKKKGLI